MCGIVAASAHRDISEILIAGLRALEYRGYDSAGIAIEQADRIFLVKVTGKINELERRLAGVCG